MTDQQWESKDEANRSTKLHLDFYFVPLLSSFESCLLPFLPFMLDLEEAGFDLICVNLFCLLSIFLIYLLISYRNNRHLDYMIEDQRHQEMLLGRLNKVRVLGMHSRVDKSAQCAPRMQLKPSPSCHPSKLNNQIGRMPAPKTDLNFLAMQIECVIYFVLKNHLLSFSFIRRSATCRSVP